ncbi:MAG TPA: exodeoxyribonuclease VII small subunit [Isosphaeraceae bacterium]|nr:exodeoxyribonuclease VII small subunit [Isosphaeraceae bacterium]
MPDVSEPTFEQALTRLEQIVDDLERGEPALSVALAQYEDGVKLLRHCYRLLELAEQSVALLTDVDAHGRPLTTAFDASATVDRKLDSTAAAADPQREPQGRGPIATNRITDRPDPSEPSDPPF